MQQLTTVPGTDRERMDVRNPDINEIWMSLHRGLSSQDTLSVMLKKIERNPELNFLFEGITEMITIAFRRLSQVERSVKETAKTERQVENDRNAQQLKELFGLESSPEKAEDPVHQLKESFKEYFSDIEDPVEFLRYVRENL